MFLEQLFVAVVEIFVSALLGLILDPITDAIRAALTGPFGS